MKLKLPGGIVLTDQDMMLGLIVCFLALTVIGIGSVIAFFTGEHWAMEMVLMGVSWWIGATMVWIAERYYRAYKGN